MGIGMPVDEGLGRDLAEFVRERCGARDARVLAFSRLSGGAIQDNTLLTLELDGGSRPGRQDFVVRSDAASRVGVSMSRAQEFAVLQVAYEAGVAVPEPLWSCDDDTLIGRAFYVMSRVPGTAQGRMLVRSLNGEAARGITRQLGEQLARLHRVRPPEPRLSFLPVPNRVRALERAEEYRRALAGIPEAHPVLQYVLNWLQDHAPASGDVVLCHGDFRTGNYMVHDDRISGVLDWEFASWSDPLEDLGWLCARSWRFGVVDREVGGVGHKADLFDAYRNASGRSVDPQQVGYWEIMAMVRWAVIALQQGRRHVSGEESSLELALTGRMAVEMEYDLLDQIGSMQRFP